MWVCHFIQSFCLVSRRIRTELVPWGDRSLNLFVWPSLSPPVSPADMGLCESMRGWRWQGCTGTFRACVGVLLLGLSLAQSASPNTACPAAVAPQSLSQPQYQGTAADDNVEGFITALVQSFLHTVQPNPFPQGQCHQYYPLNKHIETSRLSTHILCLRTFITRL